jgi:hypothetical protein
MAGEWFFSTLAQVSATVVGFIVAITMVTYSLEKERKMNRTADFRDLLEDFYQAYTTPFDEVQAALSRRDSNSVDEYVFREYDSEQIRSEMFTDDFEKHPAHIQFYCLCLHITTTTFRDLSPGKPELPKMETIESVGEAALKIQNLLDDDETGRLIFGALTNSDKAPNDFMKTEVFDSPYEDEIKALEDVKELSSEMVNDYIKLRDRFPAVYSDYTTGAYDILNISVYLIIVGTLIPLLLMFTPPRISAYGFGKAPIFISQTLLLVGSSTLTFALVDLIRVLIKSGQYESKTTEPRWLTQKLVQHLPSLI